MRTIITILFLFVATFASAQTVRQPEPVPSAAPQMFEQLETGDWIEKAEALEYLSRYDVPNAAGPVKAILENNGANWWLRGRALVALSRIEPANAVALAEAYSTGGSWQTRAAAAEICYELPADKAPPIIKALLAFNTPQVKFSALAAHARHQGASAWNLVNTLTAEVPDNCIEPASRALAWTGTDAARARLLELMEEGKHQHEVLRGLKRVNNTALAPIYLDLIATSTDSTLLADSWQALQALEREAVIAACQAALASGDEKKVQAVACLVASYLKEPALGEALQTVLAETKDRTTLLLGLSALSCVEADRFSALFISHLSHEDAQVRANAVRCLAQCKDENLYEILEKTLTDSDKTVRVTALQALRNSSEEHVPQERILEYFTPSLLSLDPATRSAAVSALAPFITLDNGEVALDVMQRMQGEYGTVGTEPLMHAVFRMVDADKAAKVLQAHGYVAFWHIIGEFPSGFGAPGEDIDGFTVAYPPEQEVDLTKRYTIKYNIKTDTRFGKEDSEEEIGWVPATVGNADGVLYMTKAGRSQLQMPRKNGVCYAHTELTVPEKTEVRLSFLFNMKAQDRVWLNGNVLNLEAKVDSKQGTATKTATVTLGAGKNRVLVKVASNDSSGAWWAPKVSTRGFALSLADKDGKPVKWSHK